MHTILGAGGVIARELTQALLATGERVRLVSRRARAEPDTETCRADLTHAVETLRAVEGSRVVYLVAGLPYRAKVWQRDWPRVMRNTIEACKRANARLVFLDNVYAYGRVGGPMTEQTPFRPCSGKGEVRALIAADLLAEMRTGSLKACIARAPDFYGPGCATSFVNLFVLAKLAARAKALWPGRDDVPHSLIYTPDAGRALAVLGLSEIAWGETWHLPTAAPALCGREFVTMAAESLGVAPRYRTLGAMAFRFAGLFNADAREVGELLYQNVEPYVFDSSKFERAFALAPTSYADGIRASAEAARGAVSAAEVVESGVRGAK